MQKNTCGFTLIELSVVLVIIGLIVGGIMVGQNMIRQTQVMSVLTDVQNFNTALKNFQQKYNALPGDMYNATTIWGAAGGSTSDNYTYSCYNSVGTGTQTCNGNGDGQIGWCWYEANRAWQQLANAGMIKGNYPQSGNQCWNVVPGIDIPVSNVPGTAYSLGYRGTILPNDTYDYPNVLNHIIYYYTLANSTGTSGAELFALDSKFDDGMPATGNLIASARQSYWDGCVNNPNGNTNPSGAVYQATNSTTGACDVFFRTGF